MTHPIRRSGAIAPSGATSMSAVSRGSPQTLAATDPVTQ